VTVDATTAAVTLRGTVAKGKMAQAVQIANENGGGKRVINQLTEN
jgi:osmotically-inducible protein OsmY